MKKVLNWIVSNKNWIFSGVGVLIIPLTIGITVSISKYGIRSFWRPEKTIHCRGSARDIQALNSNSDNPSPSSINLQKFEIEDCVITIRGGKVRVFGDITMREIKTGEIRIGNGRLSAFGSFDGEYAYLEYTITDKQLNQSWLGVSVLRIPGLGDLHGYWITNDALNSGKVNMGSITLKRVTMSD